MLDSVEMPLQFPLALPMKKLSEAISSRGYKVALTGEGADEIFGGYDCFRSDKLRRTFDHPLLRFARRPAYSKLYSWLGTPEGTVEGLIKNHEDSARIKSSFGGIYPPWYDVWFALSMDREKLLATGDHRVRPLLEAPAEFTDLVPSDPGTMDPLDAGIAFELETRLPAWILQIGDRSSMANGVETRVPFLDHRVVEFVLSLPPNYKMPGTTEKALLRRAIGDLLPKPAARRRKRPFYTPLAEWFFPTPDSPLIARYLNPDALRSAALFQPDVVEQYLAQLFSTPRKSLKFKALEWNLTLILSTQILADRFVSELPS
jgi:asparagine synthase (glutamine-hydrolysing)